jgi:hypothetical protein
MKAISCACEVSHYSCVFVLFATAADDANEGMAAGKLREAAARGNLQEVLRLIEDGAKIQTDEVSSFLLIKLRYNLK